MQEEIREMSLPFLEASSYEERRYLMGDHRPGGMSFLSRRPRQETRRNENRIRIFRAIFCVVFVTLITVAVALVNSSSLGTESLENSSKSAEDDNAKGSEPGPPTIPKCTTGPCFTPAKNRVATDKPGFPSFWKYAHRGPLKVAYDSRAIKLNGERSFFFGGSMHPSRATKATWSLVLDEAVRNGLNLVTIYVMWSAHQTLPNSKIDWGFQGSYAVDCDERYGKDESCQWNLATAIRMAASRGLFVHIRIGPYDCAEFNYGGIPEWLTLHKPNMEMRRPNREWLNAMRAFVTAAARYISENQLWAYQGGNIIMAQIENELGEVNEFESPENRLLVDDAGNFVDPPGSLAANLRNATMQDYADWCGKIAEELEPNVLWTMCNGLSANNTVLTNNAINDGDKWLEKHGGNGRIQVDQPAIFTEFEQGFQTWGSTPEAPLDYFWGRKARDMARDALRWFARGGCHLNYYMFWGGYNRGRAAAAGITNMYASDAPLCPSGERHQPKFGHFEALHEAISSIAGVLTAAETALGKEIILSYKNDNGTWVSGEKQRAFDYQVEDKKLPHVMFIENDADHEVSVRLPLHGNTTNAKVINLNAFSSILLVDDSIEFDSSYINPRVMAVQRNYANKQSLPLLLDWKSWEEPIGVLPDDAAAWAGASPIEQTSLNANSSISSDYAWYETSFDIDEPTDNAALFIETQKANAVVVFIDGEFIGAADHHLKKEGPITQVIQIPSKMLPGSHSLSILSESLGYLNLIGRWGGSTMRKQKGITGDVLLSVGGTNMSLVDGRDWKSFAGLHGENLSPLGLKRKYIDGFLKSGSSQKPTWSSAFFDSPGYDPTTQGLFVKITNGRGHLWLNGRDLGKYWNITRGTSSEYSQQYYFFPDDFLHSEGTLNELVIFNPFGETRGWVDLELSWTSTSFSRTLEDEVDYLDACI